jgi:hypothetical protein
MNTEWDWGFSAASFIAANYYRISGQFNAAPEAATATGNTASADPPSLTPSWGSTSTLWLAVAGDIVATQGLPSAPASYDGRIVRENDGGGGSNVVRLASARRSLLAATENPAAWTLPGSGQWAAATIAVRPAT